MEYATIAAILLGLLASANLIKQRKNKDNETK